jgi:transcriptional regulator with XRE-family HTH domain
MADDSPRSELGAPDVAETLLTLRDRVRSEPPEPASDADPSADIDDELARIAGRLRSAREASMLTLHELARRSGVAASTIQKVETQQMVPSVAVLLKIARGLGQEIGNLLRSPSDELRVVHQRAEERLVVSGRSGLVAERLVGDIFEPVLEVWRLTHQPGTGSGRGRLSHEGESLVLCETGEITFRVGGEEFVLHPGDTLHFKQTLPHDWRNNGSVPAQFLVAATLPRETRARLHERLRRVVPDASLSRAG